MNVSVMAMANLVGSGWVGGEGAQGGLVDGERVLGGHRLDADVVGAGGDVLLDAGAHRVGIAPGDQRVEEVVGGAVDVLVRSEEHTSELQSLLRISYAVFCLKKKKY